MERASRRKTARYPRIRKILEIRRKDKTLEVESQKETYKARRVILAVGKVGNPRKAGVEGEIENAARIAHRLLDLGVD